MKKQQKVLRVSSLALAMSLAYQVQADEIERDPILDVTDVIVVHGERASVTEAATTHWSVDAEEIKASGAQSLDQVLENVPGIYVRVGGDSTPRVDIRGLKTRHITFLINGVPASSTEDGQFDPSVIPTNQIARVDVSVGPTSVLYGPGGSAGVINIITKQGDASPSLSGKVESAPDNTLNADISAAGSGDNWQGIMSVTHQETDGTPMPDDFEDTRNQVGDIRFNSDRKLTNYYAQGSYFINDSTKLMANYTQRDGVWGKSPTVDRKKTPSRIEDFNEQSMQLGAAHEISEKYVVRGFVYYNQTDMVENFYNHRLNNLNSIVESSSKVSGTNIQFISEFDYGAVLTTSAIVEKQDWSSHTTSLRSLVRGNGSGGGTGGGQGGSGDIDESLMVYTGAAEYQYQDDGTYGYSIGAAVHNYDLDVNSETDFSAQASAFYQVTDSSRIHTGLARKVRYPSISDLYAPNSGNVNLKAEIANQFELGLQQSLPFDTQLDISSYITDANDYIAKDDNNQEQNIGDYRFMGVDLQMTNRYFDSLGLTFAYSYIDTEDRATNERLQYRPAHNLRLQASYDFSFGLTTRLNAERVIDQVNGKGVELDNYTLVDLSVSQKIWQDNLELYVRATNLFDELYYQSDFMPQAGRQVFVGINWQL
ncbi:ferric enterobactin uptake receptor [Shewanella sairae]|uniref:Ferric enterobactin uptake receptor n=1 Tax=Shewanella sairae TaxID=190310 RepID=A0ABQ4PPI1_9GAMM|nr:TonB-dependent receptor [Shewanella sairae]MCL1128460.1 TonB-dependent receptor [Shewanella sairae]GIU50415.1 ferric enterobactin uptake receptor [Shewanella sairae]